MTFIDELYGVDYVNECCNNSSIECFYSKVDDLDNFDDIFVKSKSPEKSKKNWSQLGNIASIIKNVLYLGEVSTMHIGNAFFDEIISGDSMEDCIRARLLCLGEMARRGEISSQALYGLFASECNNKKRNQGFDVFSNYVFMNGGKDKKVTRVLIRGNFNKVDQSSQKYGISVRKVSNLKYYSLVN